MTSRQTIAATQRNSSYKGRTPVSPDSSTFAIMVHIDWTDAEVVRIQANKAFNLPVQVVSVVRNQYTIIRERVNMQIASGKVLHFVKSERGDGWYYIVQVIGQELCCSCPAAKFHKGCKHLDKVQMHCEAADQREMILAGGEAQVELVEVERDGYMYPMVRVVSPTYQGKLHYTWTEDHKINRYPLVGRSVIQEIEEAVAAQRARKLIA